MGESERYIEYRNKYRGTGINFNINSPVVLLIIINFSVFLFVKFLTFGQITGDTAMVPYFYEKLNSFLVTPTFKGWVSQPWSIFTYGFFHFEFLVILGNVLWLWCFGSILQSIVGNRHTIPVYLYGAVAGALAFTLSMSLQAGPVANPGLYLYGANTAVLAVAVAATVIVPGFRILSHLNGGIPIWILTGIYLLIDLALTFSSNPPFGFSHLGGVLAGLVYALLFRRGIDGSAWMNNFYNWFINLFNPHKKEKKYSVKEKVFYNTGNRMPYQKTSNLTQQRVDEILDKIHQKGYQFLTEDEKNILKRASEEEL